MLIAKERANHKLICYALQKPAENLKGPNDELAQEQDLDPKMSNLLSSELLLKITEMVVPTSVIDHSLVWDEAADALKFEKEQEN